MANFGEIKKRTSTNIGGTLKAITPKAIDHLKNPVLALDHIKIEKGEYITPLGKTVKYDSIELKNFEMVTRVHNNIVKKNIQGLNDPIVEGLGTSETTITLRGIITSIDGFLYPQSQLQRIDALLEAKNSFVAKNVFLNDVRGHDTFVMISATYEAVSNWHNVPISMEWMPVYANDVEFSNFLKA